MLNSGFSYVVLQHGEDDAHAGLDSFLRVVVLFERLQIIVECISGGQILHEAKSGWQIGYQMIQSILVLLDGFRPVVSVQLEKFLSGNLHGCTPGVRSQPFNTPQEAEKNASGVAVAAQAASQGLTVAEFQDLTSKA